MNFNFLSGLFDKANKGIGAAASQGQDYQGPPMADGSPAWNTLNPATGHNWTSPDWSFANNGFAGYGDHGILNPAPSGPDGLPMASGKWGSTGTPMGQTAPPQPNLESKLAGIATKIGGGMRQQAMGSGQQQPQMPFQQFQPQNIAPAPMMMSPARPQGLLAPQQPIQTQRQLPYVPGPLARY